MMNNEPRCFCELAPLYALDLLDLEERLWVEAQIVNCPDLAEELATYQNAVNSIPYSAEPVPMAADLKDRLFASLAIVDPLSAPQPPIPPPAPEISSIRAQDLHWQPHRVAGVQCAVLFTDSVQRMRSMVVKVAAGVTYPIHRHGGIEEIYMLEGELTIDRDTYFAGDYIRSPCGSTHAPSTMTGCMFVIRACMDDEYC